MACLEFGADNAHLCESGFILPAVTVPDKKRTGFSNYPATASFPFTPHIPFPHRQHH